MAKNKTLLEIKRLDEYLDHKIVIKNGNRTLIIGKDRAQRTDDRVYGVHDDEGIPGFYWRTKKEILEEIANML